MSVTTPCCLPMIPSYVSYVSSAGATGEQSAPVARADALRASLLFVVGFAVVFTAIGASLGLVGATVVRLLPQAERVAGVVVVIVGLHLARVLRVPTRFGLPTSSRKMSTSVDGLLLGGAFAIGFVPTLGPVLGAVLTLASGERTVWWGAVLLTFYSLGFGIPFIAMALGVNAAGNSLRWLQPHVQRLQVAGGVLLIGVGLLFVSGRWRTFFIPVAAELSRLGWPPV